MICIEDPLREEAEAVVNSLKCAGITKVVMMTGDSERVPQQRSQNDVSAWMSITRKYCRRTKRFIEKEKAAGRKVIMIGDGINDSPALSATNVGIAISDGAEIARDR